MFRSNWTINHKTEEDAHRFYNLLEVLLKDGELQSYRVFPNEHPLRDNAHYKRLITEKKSINRQIAELENG